MCWLQTNEKSLDIFHNIQLPQNNMNTGGHPGASTLTNGLTRLMPGEWNGISDRMTIKIFGQIRVQKGKAVLHEARRVLARREDMEICL
jgi:hypothetical protein